MSKLYVLLASVAAVSLAAPAFADGKIDAKVEATDAAGTTTTSEKKVDVSTDSKGNTEKTVKTEETRDPKGLFNKSKVKTKDTEKTQSDGSVKTTHKKVVDGHTVEDTTETK